MKYYLHDSNSFSDEKITELFIKFGYEGLGLFYTILEKFALQEKPIKTIVLKSQLKVGKKLEKCWNFMESIDLISSNNGETFNKQLLKFSEKYQVKKEKNAKRISEWRENQSIKENVTHYESVRNTPKVNKSKVNKSKVKESIDTQTQNLDLPTILHPLQEYIQKELPTVSKLKTQLTEKNCIDLLNKYPREIIKSKLLNMENHSKLLTKYKSVYLTLNDWCAKSMKDEPKGKESILEHNLKEMEKVHAFINSKNLLEHD